MDQGENSMDINEYRFFIKTRVYILLMMNVVVASAYNWGGLLECLVDFSSL